MCLLDTSLAHRANAPMCAHESRRLRNYSRVLSKCLLPPDVETIGGKIQIWMELLSDRLISRRERYVARWVEFLIRHLFPIPILCCVTRITLMMLLAFCRPLALQPGYVTLSRNASAAWFRAA